MKKHTKIILITVIAVILIVPAGMYLAGTLYYTDKRIYEKTWDMNIPSDKQVYEATWNMSIPSGVKQVYSTVTPKNLRNDGLRYTVFNFDASQSDFINGFSDKKDSDMENEINAILSKLDVEDINKTNFDNSYLWM